MAGLIITNNFVVTRNHIDEAPKESDFSMSEQLISLNPTISNVVVKNLYVSIDPYQINRMKTQSRSKAVNVRATDRILPGQEINSGGVGRVVYSGQAEFGRGDLVCGDLSWGEYTVVEEGGQLRKLDHTTGFPLSYYAGGILGSSGITAYGGFFKVCKPKKGDKVFVSAACGSVGMLVGQYAKLFGCYVVGSAGTKQKVDLLKEKIGFDDAFNYKEESNLKSTLGRYFPNGIDIYFDNVGGEMLEAAVENMNEFGRVAACGVISEYTNSQKSSQLDMIRVIYKRIRIQGFLCVDFDDIHQEFISTTMQQLQTGQLKTIEDISNGVESIPTAFIDLFKGNNVGKKVVKICED